MAGLTGMGDFNLDTSKISEQDARELYEFLTMEKTKEEFRSQVTEFTDTCWSKCVDYPQNKLDSKTETCIRNCVNRFLDVTLFIANRYATKLQSGKM